MDEMGHTDPALAVYRQAMRRGEGEKAALLDLVELRPFDNGSQTSTPKPHAKP
jgi:hypothetical protein